jgi:hypothetical protein
LRPGPGRAEFIDGVLLAIWFIRSGEVLSLLANLNSGARPCPESFQPGEPVWGGQPTSSLPPWSVYAAIGG